MYFYSLRGRLFCLLPFKSAVNWNLRSRGRKCLSYINIPLLLLESIIENFKEFDHSDIFNPSFVGHSSSEIELWPPGFKVLGSDPARTRFTYNRGENCSSVSMKLSSRFIIYSSSKNLFYNWSKINKLKISTTWYKT